MSDQIADFVYGIPSSKSLVASLESALKVSELTFPARNEEDRLCGRLVAGKSADRNRVLPFRQHVELAEFPRPYRQTGPRFGLHARAFSDSLCALLGESPQRDVRRHHTATATGGRQRPLIR